MFRGSNLQQWLYACMYRNTLTLPFVGVCLHICTQCMYAEILNGISVLASFGASGLRFSCAWFSSILGFHLTTRAFFMTIMGSPEKAWFGFHRGSYATHRVRGERSKLPGWPLGLRPHSHCRPFMHQFVVHRLCDSSSCCFGFSNTC